MDSSQPKKSSFIRVPKILFEYVSAHRLTPEAVLLYALMLDRSSLSKRNGADWIDEDGNFYIVCTLASVMRQMDCGHDKATQLVKQLVNAGLITRISQGPGKTYRIIVHPVADFTPNSQRKNRNHPCGLPASNNTLSTNTNPNNTDPSSMMTYDNIEHQIKENIEYRVLLERWSARDIDNLVCVMVDTLYPRTKYITISGVRRSYQSVFDRLIALGQMEVSYVLDRLQNDTVQIRSMRAYILALLYEAPAVADFYYGTKSNFDDKKKS